MTDTKTLPGPTLYNTVPPTENFTFGSFVLMVDRLLEHVEETKMQRSVNQQISRDLEEARSQLTADIFKIESREITEAEKLEQDSRSKEYEEVEKKYRQAVSEQEQLQLKHNVLVEENHALRADLIKTKKEKVVAQSKVCEVEAKLSVHCQGKEACLQKIESLQDKFTELNKGYATLTSSFTAVEGNFKNAQTLQKKLRFLNRHSTCIVNDLQNQIKEKNDTIVKLRAAQLKDPVVIPPCKVAEQPSEHEQLVTLLKEQLQQKTSEIETTMKLLETAEVSARELSEVFLVERADCAKRMSLLEEEALRLRAQVKLVHAAVSEKEKENTEMEEELRVSNNQVEELSGELEILKSLISRDTVDAETETFISVGEMACQSEVTYPAQLGIVDSSGEIENTSPDLVDEGVNCCPLTEDKQCQVEIASWCVTSPSVEDSSPLPASTSKRSPPNSPGSAASASESPTKRLKSDELPIELESDESPLPLGERLKMPIPIPIKIEGGQITTIVEEDIESYSPERTQYNFFEELPKEEWLTVANPAVSYNSTPGETEPKTPEQLVNTQENRPGNYKNDPDYSPLSSDQSPDENIPASETETEPITLIRESPQLNGTVTSPPDNQSLEFRDSSPQPGERRSIVTLSSDTEEEESEGSREREEVRESVQRIVEKTFRQVSGISERTEKLNLYKASLSKSPNYSRTASASPRSHPSSSHTALTSVPRLSVKHTTKHHKTSTDDQSTTESERTELIRSNFSSTQVARIVRNAKTIVKGED